MSDTAEPTLIVSLHGLGVTVEDAVKAGLATKRLLEAIGREMDVEGLDWQVARIQFKCDGCGLTRPDRPSQEEGWTHSDGDDFCPACTEGRE